MNDAFRLLTLDQLVSAIRTGEVRFDDLPEDLRRRVSAEIFRRIEAGKAFWVEWHAERERGLKAGSPRRIRRRTESPGTDFLQSVEWQAAFLPIKAGMRTALASLTSWPPPDYPSKEQFSSEETLKAARLRWWSERLPPTHVFRPLARKTLNSLADYLDFRLKGGSSEIMVDRRARWSELDPELFAIVNACNVSQAREWYDAVLAAQRFGGEARKSRLLSDLRNAGARIAQSCPAVSGPLVGPLPDQRDDDSEEPTSDRLANAVLGPRRP